jgi:GT2 family glycosyltransferase
MGTDRRTEPADRLHPAPRAGSFENRLDVSVVIVNWNTRDMLRDCLRSVYEQTKDIAFEVIVVDNASADGSAAMVRTECPQTVLIDNRDNRGFAAANNQAMAVGRGRYVLLLNPDTLVLDGAVQKTVAYADAHPDVGVLGCQVWENESVIQRTCFRFPSVWGTFIQAVGLYRLFPRSRLLGREKMGDWNRDDERNVDVVSGMYMLVRREAIEAVGVMDEDYFVYGEETDWCCRFWKAGWRCVFAPIARIIHRDGGSKSTEQVSVRMFVQMQKSLLIFQKKQRGTLSWFGVKTIYTVSAFLRFPYFAVRSTLGRNGPPSRKAAQSLAALKFHLLGVEPR